MKINLPENVSFILNKLNSNGFKSYVTGGCVRDSILNLIPKDWDITTSALPNQVMDTFSDYRIIPTGLQHGTVTVVINYEMYEITTFRKDGDYSDNRRPDEVFFVNDLKEDLARRDFTVNAMAYNEKEGLIDLFGGMNDIEDKVIRCVGNANERFNEDALRMVRAIRFHSTLDFDIDSDTGESILKNRRLMKNISVERIQQELNKILLSDKCKIHTLFRSGLMDYFIPEFDNLYNCQQHCEYHYLDVEDHTFEATRNIEKNLVLKLTMLLHDIEKPSVKSTDENGIDNFYGHDKASAIMARNILTRLKYDNFTVEKVVKLIEYHMVTIEPNKRIIKRLLNKLGEDDFRELLLVRLADRSAMRSKHYQVQLEDNIKINKILDEILSEKECFSLKDLAIDGNDLIQMGHKQGKTIGIILNQLLSVVLDNPELNTKESLLKIIKESQ